MSSTRHHPGSNAGFSKPRNEDQAPQREDGASPERAWVIPAELSGRPLDGVVRALAGVSWSEARRFIETGKIRVAGEIVTDAERKVRRGGRVSLDMRAPKPRTRRLRSLEGELIVYIDASVVVVRKPAGVSTVPFGDEEPSEQEMTLDAMVRDVVARRDKIRGRAPLGVVQRLDKATTGLIVFARSFAAKKHLGQQLRFHTMHRRYQAIAHGDVRARTARSHLVPNRGDGLRGSVPEGRREGQLAVTHIEPLERLRGATLVGCRLETGRTHQIRIHLAEMGHPLVGESVYIRSYRGELIPAPRLMLHAAELGFEHPESGRAMRFEEPLPADFEETLARLREPRG